MVFSELETRRKKCLFRCQRDFQLGEVYGVKMALLAAQQKGISLQMQEIWVRSLGQEDHLQKEMATYSGNLDRIP